MDAYLRTHSLFEPQGGDEANQGDGCLGQHVRSGCFASQPRAGKMPYQRGCELPSRRTPHFLHQSSVFCYRRSMHVNHTSASSSQRGKVHATGCALERSSLPRESRLILQGAHSASLCGSAAAIHRNAGAQRFSSFTLSRGRFNRALRRAWRFASSHSLLVARSLIYTLQPALSPHL